VFSNRFAEAKQDEQSGSTYQVRLWHIISIWIQFQHYKNQWLREAAVET